MVAGESLPRVQRHHARCYRKTKSRASGVTLPCDGNPVERIEYPLQISFGNARTLVANRNRDLARFARSRDFYLGITGKC